MRESKQTADRLVEVLPVSMKKIDRVKRRFVEHGIGIVLDKRKADRQHLKKADGDFEAHLVALSCGKPPEGYARWSLRLLANKMVELEYAEVISHETVRRVLKNEIKPWKKVQWVIPPEQSGEVKAWQVQRNTLGAKIDWQFTIDKARIKLKYRRSLNYVKKFYPHKIV